MSDIRFSLDHLVGGHKRRGGHGETKRLRRSAFTYNGKHVDLKQIGRELNMRYVLEGSVQRSSSRLRVNVQLIDAETGAQEKTIEKTMLRVSSARTFPHSRQPLSDGPITNDPDMRDRSVVRLSGGDGYRASVLVFLRAAE